jgi:quercetin dioxygenase-like cupin family protein
LNCRNSAVSVRNKNEGMRVASAGNIYRIIATGDETNQRYTLLETVVDPGLGAPFHVHSREEEAFFVLDGEMVFFTDTETIRAPSGTFVHCPVGTVRGFRNETNSRARMLILLSPPGLEQMFIEDGIVLKDLSDAPPSADIDGARSMACPEISGRYGIENLPKPLPVFSPSKV